MGMIPDKLRNQILPCDCIEGMRAHLPDACIPLTITSPPYDRLRTYRGHLLPFDKFQAMARELYRVTAPGGVVVWIVQDGIGKTGLSGTSARQQLFFQEIGFWHYQTIIMVSRGMRYPSCKHYPNQFQFAFVFSKDRPKTVNLLRDRPNKCVGAKIQGTRRMPNGERLPFKRETKIGRYGRRTNIWSYTAGTGTTRDKMAYDHSAIMPEKMAQDHIRSWSQPGDLVFDPMCGSATTCKMALLNDRDFLGMEIDEKAWEVGCERMENALNEYRLRLTDWLNEGQAG